ncbi:aromatic-ring-hydroxylating dioxygenase subunit beta [Nocardioides sp. NPDC006273]|uniref:aromatic-ring-hydroxylating dioxygenase subunit beta n=1 Tax=Nocardioides sp. NPDC006273 TaxID=3155598 RepID=UPI0033BAC3F5
MAITEASPEATARVDAMAPVDPELLATVNQFLALEAKLLDEGREEDWLELLDEDLLYVVPIRLATEDRADEIQRGAFRIRDTKYHVRTRLQRLATGHAYSEIPPSRTMRLVGSVLVQRTADADIVDVTSALLVYRQRGIDDHFDLIPCRRNDTLRLTAQGPRLLTREVILTEVGIATPNLGVFL